MHVPFEGPGAIERWAQDNGTQLVKVFLFDDEPLPALRTGDLLLVMGGPMNVDEEQRYPFLREEKSYLREAIDAGHQVLGICLGAQLIAAALGAAVYPNGEREIGWLPIELSTEAKSSPFFFFPPSLEVFHWHGDTFYLPEGARLIASSAACRNQAFVIGHGVIGLQFHLEATPESAAELIANGLDDLASPGKYVQSAEQITADRARFAAINDFIFRLLDRMNRLNQGS